MIDMMKTVEKMNERFKMFIDVFFDAETERVPGFTMSAFPPQMGEYVFEEELMKERTDRAYRLGLYRNDIGARAIAKRWAGPHRSIASYWLRNEISAYKILWKVIGSHPELAERFPRVHIPRLIDTIERNDELVLLIEYIDGRPLAESSKKQKLVAYTDALNFLAAISRLVGGVGTFDISVRTVWHSLALVPIIAVRAIMRHPSLTMFVLRTAASFLMRTPALLKDEVSGFSHRDLGDWNILVRENDIWIIDFQLAAIAHPLTDVVGVLLKCWDEPDFGKAFLGSEYVSSLLAEKAAREKFRALSAHLAIYNLSLKSGRRSMDIIGFESYQFCGGGFFAAWKRHWKQLKQEMYIFMYSSKDRVDIKPFDPAGEALANTIISDLRSSLPEHLIVHLIGSVSMHISGQHDIDIFVECKMAEFDIQSARVSALFGNPTRKKRDYVEWQFKRNNWEIDVLLIDPTTEKFNDQVGVVRMIQHSEQLRHEYDQLKRSCDGMTIREYERVKHEFLDGLRKNARKRENIFMADC